MKSKRGIILGSSNWSKRSGNAEGKGRRSIKLASTQKHQGGAKVLGPSQLLQKVYKGLCQNSCTATHAGQKRVEMEVGKEARGSIWKTQSNVYYRTSISYFGHRQKDESGSKYLILCNWGMLSTKCKDKKQRLVAFISKLLNTTEQNYKIHDKEMLAVIRCLEAWRHYLEGAKLEFEIWTNYKNLQYFMTSQKLNHRQARQALYLLRFNFVLKHVPGKSMGKVDELSRRPDWQEGVERDNKDQKLIKPEWVRGAKTLVKEGNLKERIKRAQEEDKKVVKAVEELKKAGIKTLRDKEQKIENGMVMKEGRIYVPEGKLRREIIRLHHDTLVGEHRGRQKITELVTRNYQWLGVMKEVERYVDEYNACQRYKNQSKAPAEKLMSNLIPEKPWSHISADFITKLLLAQEYDAILVVCDRFSKMVHFIVTTKKTSAERLAKLF